MDKQFLENCLKQDMSSRQIAKLKEVNIGARTIVWYIHKYNLTQYMNYKKPQYNEDYFNKIDTKEKAYIMGYTLADGYITQNTLAYGCALADKEILNFIQSELGGIVRESHVLDRATRKFPSAHMSIGNKKILQDLLKYTGCKEEKTFPRIPKHLEPYMLLGFFDGDGCITWGKRKDRNRIWQKVNFTGSYKLLSAVQKLLLRLEISSSLHKKGTENCYVLETSSKKDVLKILQYMYQNETFVVLRRKFEKYNALRLELGEFGETIQQNTIPSQADDHSSEGVETTGGKTGSLNNQQECPSL